MSKFIKHLESLIDVDHPTIKEVYADRVAKTDDFNNRTLGQIVFRPGNEYEQSYSNYNMLHYSQRVRSNSAAVGIWGVNNIELYEMYYDHVNSTDSTTDTLVDIGNNLLSNSNIETNPNLVELAPLFSPIEMKNKGVYNSDVNKNYFKVKSDIDTLTNGTPLTTWFEFYTKHFNGLKCDGWDANYLSWKETLNVQSVKYKKNMNSESKASIMQSLLEIGWMPGVKISPSSTIISKIRRRDIPKAIPIDSDMVTESAMSEIDIDTANWVWLICISNSDKTEFTPYLTTNGSDVYMYRYGKSLVKKELTTIMSKATHVIVYGIRFDSTEPVREISACLRSVTTTSIYNAFDINSSMSMDGLNENVSNILVLFMTSILDLYNNNDQRSWIHTIEATNGNIFKLKDTEGSELTPIYLARLTSIVERDIAENIHRTPGLDEALKELSSKPTPLNLFKLKSYFESTLTGVQLELFNLMYEQVIGSTDTKLTEVITEAVNDMHKQDILNEAKGGDNMEYFDRLDAITNEASVENVYKLWQFISETEGKIYSSANIEDRGELYLSRYKAYIKLNELAIELEKNDSSFNLEETCLDLSRTHRGNYIDKGHIKHSINLLKK